MAIITFWTNWRHCPLLLHSPHDNLTSQQTHPVPPVSQGFSAVWCEQLKSPYKPVLSQQNSFVCLQVLTHIYTSTVQLNLSTFEIKLKTCTTLTLHFLTTRSQSTNTLTRLVGVCPSESHSHIQQASFLIRRLHALTGVHLQQTISSSEKASGMVDLLRVSNSSSR